MSEQELQDWLVERIAKWLGVDRDDIDTTRSFASSGLDSVAAVSLTGDLEDLLETRLSPTVIWDHPNVEALARHLAKA